ncbi:folylpolyglutamate synthase/dihydrofolate synthase family protein [Eubacterium sp.]|uniref:bifunctional folylpolyglutamate synthase/dihydrofolate synthase n=1 Tax=Eubacterium sp. TaxID=142586 RepID=UPI0025F0E3B2|nr:folylpolyglutamate synthase/dihydrofolate synthase family protein [Eubacterium sp.]MCR5628113.1 bifunctional folylpolyglutamate synthase/dihydrofolate synthase [Eubacterium sp.]
MKVNKQDLMKNPKVANRLTKMDMNPLTTSKHKINTYEEARAFVSGCSDGKIELGLENVRNLMEKLGNPQESLSIIHVAGTNGKGSVIAFLTSIFEKAGLRVGRFTSPAVFSYEEMFYADKSNISEDEYAKITSEVADKYDDLVNEGRYKPTTFEVEFAIACLFFKMKRCDIVLIETGMGGSLDATNIIQRPICTVITSIGMDHMAYLGKNISDIAKAKAGIIKFGIPCISIEQSDEVKLVLDSVAKERLTAVTYVDKSKSSLYETTNDLRTFLGGTTDEIGLKGDFQIENSLLARKVAMFIFNNILGSGLGNMEDYFEGIINEGIKTAVHPGRFEKISDNPDIYIDGAHNEDAAIKLANSIDRYFGDRPVVMIMGIFKDKDYKTIAKVLAPKATKVCVVSPESDRGLDTKVLEEVVSKYCNDTKSFNEYKDAVLSALDYVDKNVDDKTNQPVILICGTLSILKDMKDIVSTLRVD